MSTGKVILGLMAGLAVGAIAGVLYAPEKGSTTRKQILDKGEGYVDDLKSKYDDLCDSIAQKLESTKRDAENIASKGKATYDEVKKDIKNGVSDMKQDASNSKHAIS